MTRLLEERAPIVRAALDLLYPPRCGGCDRLGHGWWCAACEAKTTLIDPAQHVRVLHTDAGHDVRVISACAFAPPLQQGIHRFKYEGQPQMHAPFSRYMHLTWRAYAAADHVFVPVPLHRGRLRERGFNQSVLLARDVAQAVKCGLSGAVVRTRPTAQQAHLSPEARKTNVRGAFEARSKAVAGRHVVLVDDVLTTGATLCECADALYVAGASEVMALTLARA